MKFIFLFSLILLPFLLSSQSCSFDVELRSQAELDSFVLNHPECDSIEGDLFLRNIIDLEGLSQIVSVKGTVYLLRCFNTTLDGLHNIKDLDSLFLDKNYELDNLHGLNNITKLSLLSIRSTPTFKALTGLNSIDSIGSLSLQNLDSLTNLEGLESLRILDNFGVTNCSSFESLTGLENVQELGAIGISENAIFDNLSALSNITQLWSYSSAGAGISLWDNQSLSSLYGLHNITKIERSLDLRDNPILNSLEGLNKLSSIGKDINITFNDNLTSLNGLDSLIDINGYIRLIGNNQLSNIDALENLDANSFSSFIPVIAPVTITDNPLLSNCSILSICNYLDIEDSKTEITNNLLNCNSREEVESFCNQIVDVNSVDLSTLISVFPNPSNHHVFINLNSGSLLSYKLFDLNGSVILNGDSTLLNNYKIDISSVRSGLYLLKVNTDTGVFMTKIQKI